MGGGPIQQSTPLSVPEQHDGVYNLQLSGASLCALPRLNINEAAAARAKRMREKDYHNMARARMCTQN